MELRLRDGVAFSDASLTTAADSKVAPDGRLSCNRLYS